MKVHTVGNALLQLEIEARFELQGHRRSSLAEADLVLDLGVARASKQTFLSFGHDLDIEAETQASIYTLAYASSATTLADLTPHPSRVIGFSLLAPITDSSIVEITRPLQTPLEELEQARAFFASLGFSVVEVPDGPGLVRARIIACLANEAFSALSEGVADASTIDTAMKLGLNYPRGPLEWAELIGLDSILAILEGLQAEYGEDRYRPHPLLRRLVASALGIAQYEAWKRGE